MLERNETKNMSSKILSRESLLSVNTYIYIYTVLVLSVFVIGLNRAICFYTVCSRSSQQLHNMVFKALIQTSMRFFDTNSSGRILNRFSKDMAGIDELLPKAMMDSAQINLAAFGSIVITCIVNPWFLIPVAIMGIVSYWIRRIYLKTSKNVKRLEGISL